MMHIIIYKKELVGIAIVQRIHCSFSRCASELKVASLAPSFNQSHIECLVFWVGGQMLIWFSLHRVCYPIAEINLRYCTLHCFKFIISFILFYPFIQHTISRNPLFYKILVLCEYIIWNLFPQPPPYIPPQESGCTACVAAIRGYKIIIGNAGHSRCIISRNGQVYYLFLVKCLAESNQRPLFS